jgi:hypothetical protein
MTGCVDCEILHRFAEGTTSGSERRQVVRHLLAGCGPCAASLRSAFRPAIEAGAYDGVLSRFTTWARDRQLAEAANP